MAASAITVPGPKIADAPFERSSSWSPGGMTPPATIRILRGPQLGERVAQCGHQREVPGSQRRHPDDVHVGLDGLARDLLGGLEERAHVDVEAEVGERGGDDLLTAVVAVLAHLRHEDAGPAPLGLLEGRGGGAGLLDRGVLTHLVTVDAGDRPDVRAVPAVDLLQCVGDLADRGVRAGGVDGELEQVAVQAALAGPVLGRLRGVRQRVEGGGHRGVVAVVAQLLQTRDLLAQHVGVVDLEHLDVLAAEQRVLVHADHRLAPGVDPRLGARGGLLDAHLRQALVDRLGHAAGLLDLLDVGPGASGQLAGEALDVGRAAPRVHGPRRARLLLKEELGVAGDARGEVGRERQRLVEGVGVQRLGVPLGGGHRLDAGADDVVVDVLRGQRPARGLRVGAQRERLVVLRPEVPDELGPQQPRRPQLRDLHEVVHADAPEEGQARREAVDVEPGVPPGPQVLDAVGEGVRELQVGRRPGLLDVVAGDGDRVELRHLLRGVGEDVGDDLHRGLGRIDVGVPDHELLEDVVLDGPGELLGLDALLGGRGHVERHHGEHGPVHGHGHRHPVQRDAVEELTHVEDRVDRHARHADVPGDAGVVGVVPAVGRQVEGDREPLLPGGEVAPVEGVRLLRRREPGVLAHRPGLGDVHRRVRPAQERRQTGQRREEVQALGVGRGVERLDGDPLRGLPEQVLGPLPGGGLEGLVPRPVARPLGRPELDVGERSDAHQAASPVRWSSRSVSSAAASHPEYRYPVSAVSSSLVRPSVRGEPARITRVAPASASARARSAACSA